MNPIIAVVLIILINVIRTTAIMIHKSCKFVLCASYSWDSSSFSRDKYNSPQYVQEVVVYLSLL